jgi:D-alanine transaminase
VWIVKDGVLIGPPKDNLVLTGIRYGLLERLCQEGGIPFALRRVSRDEVFGADELILSSASKEVLPVVTLDGKTIGNGHPGPIYKSLYAAYQQAKQRNAEKQGATA